MRSKHLFICFSRAAVFCILLSARTLAQPAVTVDNLAITIGSALTITVNGDFKNQNNGTIANAGTVNVSGNWTNNASNAVFSTSSGTVILDGTGMQTIGGTNATSFYNLTMNNSSSSGPQYTLGADEKVMNTLSLQQGKMNLANHTMTTGSSAALPGNLTYTAGWLYGGTLKRWFPASVIANGLFPVGSSTNYRPFSVSIPSTAPSAGGTVSVVHSDSAGSISSSFTDINIVIDRIFNSSWTVTTGNGLTGGAYTISAAGTGFTGISDYTQLRLILPAGSVGINGTNSGSNANPTVVRTGLTAAEISGRFYIGYPAGIGPLPVTLVQFTAARVNDRVKLNWITAAEINSDYFTIERSADGEIFNMISKVQAAGTSNVNRYYTTIDNEPFQGVSYYRLKETDFDGSYIYSSPVSVRMDGGFPEIISVHKNDKGLVLNILSSLSEPSEMNLYDITGRLIWKKNQVLGIGHQDVIIPMTDNAKAVYLINMKTSSGSVSKMLF